MLSLLELFFKIEERGGQATLAVTTDSGKTKIKFEVASPSTTFGTGSSPSMPTSSAAPQPAPGKRKRSGAARRKAKLRAAAHQVTLAAAAGAVLVPPPPSPPSASSPPRPPRPLHHLLSPSPSSGRRRVMPLGRPEMLTFSSLNLDGASSPSPTPTPPTPSSASPSPSTPSPSPPVCYRGCTWHCDSCGKCPFLCQDHSGCACCEDLPPHCAVCCCLRDALDCPFAHLQ